MASRQKRKHEIEVQVLGFGVGSGYAMHIDANQSRVHRRRADSRFFEYFAASGVNDAGIRRLDVATGLKPALQLYVLDQHYVSRWG